MMAGEGEQRRGLLAMLLIMNLLPTHNAAAACCNAKDAVGRSGIVAVFPH